MTTYTWLQMIRMLTGREPGHPYIPDTEPVLDIQPKLVCDLLRDGHAQITGLPYQGGRREPIPSLQWDEIHIQLSTKSEFTNGKFGFGTIARLSGDDGWYDLTITDVELHKLKSAVERLRSLERQRCNIAPSPEIYEVALSAAAARIAELNPSENADRLLARLRFTLERGAIRVVNSDAGAEPEIAEREELARWCHARGYVAPPEWAPDVVPEEVVPTDQDPEVYITPQETAQWLAWHAADPTESLQWAVDKKLIPTLQRGALNAEGMSDSKSGGTSIPREVWANLYLVWLTNELDEYGKIAGGELWRDPQRDQEPLWRNVKFLRHSVLNLWPPHAATPHIEVQTPEIEDEASSKSIAVVQRPPLAKYTRYDALDRPLVERVLAIMREQSINALAAVREIPVDEIAGTGTPANKTHRIYQKALKEQKAAQNSSKEIKSNTKT